jgi:hypothetical protein
MLEQLVLPEKRDLQKEMNELQARFDVFNQKNPHIRVVTPL